MTTKGELSDTLTQTGDATTPIYVTARTRNLILLGCLIGVIVAFALSPLARTAVLGGVTIALLLLVPVGFAAKWMPRALAVTIVTLGALGLGALLILVLIPIVAAQLYEVVQEAPQFEASIEQWASGVAAQLQAAGWIETDPSQAVSKLRSGVASGIAQITQAILDGLVWAVENVVLLLFQLFAIMFVATYLLADFARWRDGSVDLVPARYRADYQQFWRDMTTYVSRFMAAELGSCIEQGVLIWILLTIIGVPYATLLAVIMACTAILPYIGVWVGGIPGVLNALTVSPATALLAGLSYLAVNEFDGNVVAPRLQGAALRVSPLITFLAVIIGVDVAGAWGAILALPLVAAVRVIYDFLRARLRVRSDAAAA